MQRIILIIFICSFSVFACISCGTEDGRSNVNYNLDSIFSCWEHETNTIIEHLRDSDSDFAYYVGPNNPLYNEKDYIHFELMRDRESILRSALPVLMSHTDSILVREFYYMAEHHIYIYSTGKVYIYDINLRNHLPNKVSVFFDTDVSQETSRVIRGFYYSYSKDQINDLACSTLITKQGDVPKIEVLALVINGVAN